MLNFLKVNSWIVPSGIALLSFMFNIIQFLYNRKDKKDDKKYKKNDKIAMLENELAEIKSTHDIENKMIRNVNGFYTINDDKTQIPYCAVCWGQNKKQIQVKMLDHGDFKCIVCNNRGIYDNNSHMANVRKNNALFNELNSIEDKKGEWWNV